MPSTFTLALAQINPLMGDIRGNAQKIRDYAERAHGRADLVLFPEMALTGYPPEDLILTSSFREAAMETVEQLAADTANLSCDLLIGSVWHDGTRTYNASILLSKGCIDVVRCKHELPNYGVFDEKRIFAPGPSPKVLHWRGFKLGVLICEEVWDDALPGLLKSQGAELLLVQNASPYSIGKSAERKHIVSRAAQETGLPVVYLNLVGGQDELVFDGRSYIHDPESGEVATLSAFAEALAFVTFKREGALWHISGGPHDTMQSGAETIYHALTLGLRDYVEKNRFKGVVLGLSGGIDSGLTAAIAVDALGPNRVLGVLMPSPYTSVESIEDAEALAQNLGIRTETVAITQGMHTLDDMLAPIFRGLPADTTEENIQARLRGLVLMSISNKLGHMVLTTGNKSELSVGYATLYGDMCGGYSVLKDVYKTTVYKLCDYRNSLKPTPFFQGPRGPVIPKRMIEKPPSAELRPNQTDQDSLPPYDLLDAILKELIENRRSVGELASMGFPREIAARVASMLSGAEYKRRQSAPGVKITSMAFGRDRRYPITNGWKFD
jgi:NAD+ synthase